jgi:hypothetical protein
MPSKDQHRDNTTRWVYRRVIARDPGSAVRWACRTSDGGRSPSGPLFPNIHYMFLHT